MESERTHRTIGIIALVIAVIGITIAFATLSRVLNINGTARTENSSWSIVWEEIDNETIVSSTGVILQSGYPKLDNVSLVKDNNAQLTGTTLDLGQITLHKPGDKATFKINIANNGDIDAIVTGVAGVSVNSTYVSYSVKYLDNEEVSNTLNGRLLATGDKKLVTIEVKFKEDVTTEQYNQIPQNGVTVDLNGVTITYTQNDGTGIADNSNSNCVSFEKKSTYYMGDVIGICNEQTGINEEFYVLSDDDTTVTALAKYNLLVGSNPVYESSSSSTSTSISNDSEYGIQSSKTLVVHSSTRNGSIAFAEDHGNGYWSNNVQGYPAWVFNSSSYLWTPIQNYQLYLVGLGKTSVSVSIPSYEQITTTLGCSYNAHNCSSAPLWVSTTSYWIGSASSSVAVYYVNGNSFSSGDYNWEYSYGVRPVITISKSDI